MPASSACISAWASISEDIGAFFLLICRPVFVGVSVGQNRFGHSLQSVSRAHRSSVRNNSDSQSQVQISKFKNSDPQLRPPKGFLTRSRKRKGTGIVVAMPPPRRAPAPAGLGHAWAIAGVGGVAQADAAEAELLGDRLGSAAFLAARVGPDLELGLALLLLDESLFGHYC